MAVVALGFGGPMIVRMMGMEQPPDWLAKMLEQRSSLIGVYFVLNMVGTQLTQTGAFEVSLDGHTIYSALETGGRVPSVHYIARKLVEAGLHPAPSAREWLQNGDAGGFGR